MKKHTQILYCFLLLALISCKKDPVIWNLTNLSGNKINVVGHGGMGIKYKYPMNSMKSLNEVLLLGAFGTEMDVRLTKDSVLVLFHSNDLRDATNKVGEVENKLWSEVKEAQYKIPLFDRVPIISAEDFFLQVKNPQNSLFVFDCKLGTKESQLFNKLFARALFRLVSKYKLEGNYFVESFSPDFLQSVRAVLPDAKLFAYTGSFVESLSFNNQVELYGITINQDYITKEEIERAHSLNLRVALFNADTRQQNLNAIAKSPDYIQTDNVEYLLKVLKE